MNSSITFRYTFQSTGNIVHDKNSKISGIQRIFSRIIGSLKQIKTYSDQVDGCIVDFRLVHNPKVEQMANSVKLYLIISFKLIDEPEEDELEEMKRDLKKYCESLLTFTVRQSNFTIEEDGKDIFNYNEISTIIEVFKPTSGQGRKTKLTTESFKYSSNISKMANLMLRSEVPIGYSIMINLHGWDDQETSLILQGGIQSYDPLSRMSTYLVQPLGTEDDSSDTNMERSICKIRIFSCDELSPFFVSELLECISPEFLKTDFISKDCETFQDELDEIKLFNLNGTSNPNSAHELEPVILKVYRSLGIDEISLISPIPRGNIPGIKNKQYKSFYPSLTEISNKGTQIGTVRTEASVQHIPVHISDNDRLRHTYIIGKTGTGKSSLLATMITQDILNEVPSIVIDPHGELCDEIISVLPEACLEQVVLIDPSKSYFYKKCSLNVFDLGEINNEIELLKKKDYWTNELTTMFISLYGGEVFGPRIQEYFRAACLTLMEPSIKGTLVDVPRLFTDSSFRRDCRAKLKDEDAIQFWKTYDQMGEREKTEMIPYFSAKFNPLIRSHVIRSFVGQNQSGLDLESILSENKTVLIRLSKGELSELGMRLIGMLIMSRIKSFVFARAKIEKHKRKVISLYVDEFQNFISESFDTLLSESRKFGLGLVIAHQYLSQMDKAQFALYGSNNGGSLLDAILGNIGNLITFRIGVKDSNEILPFLGNPISKNDLINLENYQFISRILNNGILSSPMTVSAYRHELLDYQTNLSEFKARRDYILEQFKINNYEYQ